MIIKIITGRGMNGKLKFFFSSFTSPETFNKKNCKSIFLIKFLGKIILSCNFLFLMIK